MPLLDGESALQVLVKVNRKNLQTIAETDFIGEQRITSKLPPDRLFELNTLS